MEVADRKAQQPKRIALGYGIVDDNLGLLAARAWTDTPLIGEDPGGAGGQLLAPFPEGAGGFGMPTGALLNFGPQPVQTRPANSGRAFDQPEFHLRRAPEPVNRAAVAFGQKRSRISVRNGDNEIVLQISADPARDCLGAAEFGLLRQYRRSSDGDHKPGIYGKCGAYLGNRQPHSIARICHSLVAPLTSAETGTN